MCRVRTQPGFSPGQRARIACNCPFWGAMSCYPPTTLLGGAAAGISGPAQRFRHAQRARQWLNTPLRSGPGCRDAPFPPTLDVGSTRDARAQLNAQAFQLKTQRKSITITYNLKANANYNTGFYVLWHGFRLKRRSAFTSGDT